MLTTPLESLKKYVDQPSGSHDREDVAKVAAMFAEDFQSLGFETELIPGQEYGPVLKAAIGTGDKQLMLMGHMDTVFPRAVHVPFTEIGDGKALGSGSIDMKGGDVVMLYALQKALPKVDLKKVRICAVLNPDEEVGSPESHKTILETARQSFAALSFEPCSSDYRLTCARKGVTSVRIRCTGIPGHSGAQYKVCASAIQALCAHITQLYALRDDKRDISFNAGLISGGTAENVVAPEAVADCEFRYFNEQYKPELMQKIQAICAMEPVPGVKTEVTFGASHPAIDLNEKSQRLLDLALGISEKQGQKRYHEKTGGAGDISIAGQAGIGVLDGLGLAGEKMHTVEECVYLDSLPKQIEFAAEMIREAADLA
ncbi:MAG: M20/M25/M40 family metallo-hydrolase [Clostridia bacterium]|nr:M20/M25/M40 family metallo-hydrolase [Clostridia bacterium]